MYLVMTKITELCICIPCLVAYYLFKSSSIKLNVYSLFNTSSPCSLENTSSGLAD